MIKYFFLNSENEIRNIWWIALFFLILISIMFPLIIASQRFSFDISFQIQAIIILVASIICQLLRRKPISDLFGRINHVWLKELCFGILIGGALMVFPALILTIFGVVDWQISDLSYKTIISGLTMFIAVAAAEELLFRGFIFQRLIAAFGHWPAQLLIAGLFLLTHLNNPGMTGIIKILASVNIFIASILFGIAYVKTKGLAMPFGIHLMANFVQGTILGFGVSGNKDNSLFRPIFNNIPVWISGGEFGLEASILGLLFIIPFTLSFYLCYTRKDID